jgi:hypothetical protein
MKFTHCHGKCSTARISISQKPVFQPNPKIRCVIFFRIFS